MHTALFICVVLLLHCVVKSNALLKLPPYIKPCSRSDPNFDECAIKNGEAAFSEILKGDSQYRIPSLVPLKINRVTLETNQNLKLYATNIEIHGFDETKIQKFHWDLEKRHVFLKLFSPIFTILGTYNMDGHVLIMSLKGSGPMNNTHYDNNITIEVNYDIENRNGVDFLKLQFFDVDIKTTRAHFHFENLLNNPRLSEQMNGFLNENWQILIHDLFPPIKKIMMSIIRSILDPLAAKIPYDEVVTP